MGMRIRPIALPRARSPRCRVPRTRVAGGRAAARALSRLRRARHAHDHPSRVNAAGGDDGDRAGQRRRFHGRPLVTDPIGLERRRPGSIRRPRVLHLRRPRRPTAPLRQALFDFVASGKGFVGFHSATDSFYSWPEYGTFIGARFINHGSDNQPGTIRVEDPNHVAMQGFSNPFTFTEEFYLFRGPERDSVDSFTRGDLHVLMNLDPATPTPARPAAAAGVPAAPGDRPAAGLDAPARRRPHVLLGVRPSAGDLGQPAVPGPRRWRRSAGRCRRRRRRPERRWEMAWGLRELRRAPASTAPNGDPDGDGRTNGQELAAGTHPRGFAQRYLAEGRDQQLLRDADRRAEPEPDLHVARAAALSAGQRRRCRPTRSRWRRARAGR